jgi:ABC-2 type transport system ATP-binding protein
LRGAGESPELGLAVRKAVAVTVLDAPPQAAGAGTAVLAAGVGVRRRGSRSLRTASFRLESPLSGHPALGLLVPGRGAASAVIDLLAGLAAPSYGELRVLGEDMGTERGRAAVRARIGVARRDGRARPGIRVRGLVEHAARRTRLPRGDRNLLAAAIIDQLALTGWADVPLRAVPDLVARRARLAAAAVHQPELLLLDGLLDGLDPLGAAELADGIRDVGLDTGVVAAGTDADTLALACGDLLTLDNGILVRDA